MSRLWLSDGANGANAIRQDATSTVNAAESCAGWPVPGSCPRVRCRSRHRTTAVASASSPLNYCQPLARSLKGLETVKTLADNSPNRARNLNIETFVLTGKVHVTPGITARILSNERNIWNVIRFIDSRRDSKARSLRIFFASTLVTRKVNDAEKLPACYICTALVS